MSTEITAEDALALAKKFREASTALGDFTYRPEVWARLSPPERERLISLELTLLNVSTDLITQAVATILDDAQQSVAELGAVTDKAKDAIKNINNVKQAIDIASALIGLATAISAGNPGAILASFVHVKKAVDSMPDKPTAEKKKGKAAVKANPPASDRA